MERLCLYSALGLVIGVLGLGAAACGPGRAGSAGTSGRGSVDRRVNKAGLGSLPEMFPLAGSEEREDLKPAQPPPPSRYHIRSGDVL